MGTKVNELGTALQEISTSIDKDDTSSKTFPMDGKLEPPADSYDKYWYSAFFDEERPGVEELDTNEKIRNYISCTCHAGSRYGMQKIKVTYQKRNR